MTITTLIIGTVIRYNDMANVDLDFVVLDSYTDDFGTWVNCLNKETNSIEAKSANTEIGTRWTIVANG